MYQNKICNNIKKKLNAVKCKTNKNKDVNVNESSPETALVIYLQVLHQTVFAVNYFNMLSMLA